MPELCLCIGNVWKILEHISLTTNSVFFCIFYVLYSTHSFQFIVGHCCIAHFPIKGKTIINTIFANVQSVLNMSQSSPFSIGIHAYAFSYLFNLYYVECSILINLKGIKTRFKKALWIQLCQKIFFTENEAKKSTSKYNVLEYFYFF